MAFVIGDRIQETTNSPGTGTATLLGAVSGYQSFSTGIGANNTTYYTIADQTGSNWEVGLGALNSTGTVLTRTTVYSSSNGGSTVNFATGTQYVWCDYPSSKAVLQGNPVNFSSIGATTAGTGAFTTLSASSTVSGAGFSNYFAAPPTIGNTTPNAGTFTALVATSITDSGLTSGRVNYAGTGGLLQDSANMTFDGSTLTTLNTAYTGTLTGGTGIVNLGSGQFYKDASGNVGIGTTSPLATLDILNNQAALSYLIDTSNTTNGGSSIWRMITRNIANTGTTDVEFYKPTGSGFYLNNNDTNASNFTAFAVGASERMRIDSSGNLLVGTTTTTFTNSSVQINGGYVVAGGYRTHNGTSGSSWNSNFNLYWTGSATQLWIDTTNVGTITVVSDYRLKDNVVTQSTSAIDRIQQLRPVTYTYKDYEPFSWKADGLNREGFIAHELQEIIPSAVEGEKDAENQIQSLKLDALCSVMVKAIQELNAKVDAQAAEIIALQTKVGT